MCGNFQRTYALKLGIIIKCMTYYYCYYWIILFISSQTSSLSHILTCWLSSNLIIISIIKIQVFKCLDKWTMFSCSRIVDVIYKKLFINKFNILIMACLLRNENKHFLRKKNPMVSQMIITMCLFKKPQRQLLERKL